MSRSVLVVLICFAQILAAPSLLAAGPPAEGGQLPEIRLPIPENPEMKAYLGLSGSGFFTIPQIKAEVILVEIFSMYCPHCQREAPTLNAFYRRIENNPHLRGRMKIIGIGTGNSDYEIDYFRKTYDIPFPLFSDKDYAIHKMVGEVRTPYFIGIRVHPDGSHTVFYSKLGGPKEAQQFLDELLERSGLK